MRKTILLIIIVVAVTTLSSCVSSNSASAGLDGQALVETAVELTMQAILQTSSTVKALPTISPTSTPETRSNAVYYPSSPLQPNYQDWLTYANAAYGFSFSYPSEWTVVEIHEQDNILAGHSVQIMKPGSPEIKLIMNYRWNNEVIRLSPTGMGGGELLSRGSIPFLGSDLERIALVGENKDTDVYYQASGPEVQRGDLVFVLMLHCQCSPLDPVTLTGEDEKTADWILASTTIVNQ